MRGTCRATARRTGCSTRLAWPERARVPVPRTVLGSPARCWAPPRTTLRVPAWTPKSRRPMPAEIHLLRGCATLVATRPDPARSWAGALQASTAKGALKGARSRIAAQCSGRANAGANGLPRLIAEMQRSDDMRISSSWPRPFFSWTARPCRDGGQRLRQRGQLHRSACAAAVPPLADPYIVSTDGTGTQATTAGAEQPHP